MGGNVAKPAKKSAAETWGELQKLQALRDTLEHALETKKYSEVDREAVLKQLAHVRKSIGRMVVR
jgi:hypothetical protein